ncbi:MAG TPA: protein kinase [Burkholderiales bacterium]|nr:protein kinase [Burkholderiales bacterium]
MDKIGKYEIRLQVGRGAMGTVYEGFDPTIGRRVAIKTLRTDVFEQNQLSQVLERFKREAQSAGRLSHPHIVTIHEYGEDGGTPYIVMEFIGGDELGTYLERGARPSLDDVVRIMTQLLGALSHAHEHGVVHRDLKPANMFLLKDGSLKVVDFGIARVEASNLTETGAMLGTPAYMSPEQFLGMTVDHHSDIYSAGVILYQLLTGDKPFTGSVTTIMQKVLRQEAIEPSAINPMISSVWDKVVARAMAKKPEARYESARQFSDAIRLAQQADRSSEEAERRKRTELEEHALREAEDRSKNEARLREETVHREVERAAHEETEARIKREVEERVRRETAVRLEQEKQARTKAAAVDGEATLASREALTLADKAKKSSLAVPVIIATFLIAGSVGAYLLIGRSPVTESAPTPVAQTSAPQKIESPKLEQPTPSPTTPEVAAVDEEKIRREAEERVRREFAEKAETEKAVVQKAAMAKAAAENALSKQREEETRKARDEVKQRQLAEQTRKREEEARYVKEQAPKAEAEKVALEKAAVVASVAPVTKPRLVEGFDGKWKGDILCGELKYFTPGGVQGPTRTPVFLTVIGKDANSHYETSNVVDDWTGTVSGNKIAFQGYGRRKTGNLSTWTTNGSGTFSANSFEGVATIFSGGKNARDCTVTLTRE